MSDIFNLIDFCSCFLRIYQKKWLKSFYWWLCYSCSTCGFQEKTLKEFRWKQKNCKCVYQELCFQDFTSQVELSEVFYQMFFRHTLPSLLTGSSGIQIFHVVKCCQSCSTNSISAWCFWPNSLSLGDIWMKLSGLAGTEWMKIVNGIFMISFKEPVRWHGV